MHGNRDFLMGHDFARLVGATLLPEQILLEVDQQLIYLSHGDELCTDDKGFMLFRYWTRQRWLQRLFFKLPIKWRIGIANKARKQSKTKQASSSYNHMKGDVVQSTVEQLIKEHPTVNGMVHGHTHQPHKHQLVISDKSYWRLVLPDWELDQDKPRGGYAILNSEGIQLIKDWKISQS